MVASRILQGCLAILDFTLGLPIYWVPNVGQFFFHLKKCKKIYLYYILKNGSRYSRAGTGTGSVPQLYHAHSFPSTTTGTVLLQITIEILNFNLLRSTLLGRNIIIKKNIHNIKMHMDPNYKIKETLIFWTWRTSNHVVFAYILVVKTRL